LSVINTLRKKVFRVSAVAFILVFMAISLIFPRPVYAIGDATYVTIVDASVFQNVWENGDQLYMVQYDIDYTVTPSENANTTFVFQLYNAGAIIDQVPLLAYGNYVCVIYRSAADAFTWGSGYTIRIGGNPSVPFPSGYNAAMNQDEKLLSAGYWQTGTFEGTTPDLLGTEVISMSNDIFNRTGGVLDWLTDASLLNTAGALVWNTVAPGLEEVIGKYYEVSTTTPTFTRATMPGTLQTNLDAFGSARLRTAMANLGTWIGVPGGTLGAVGLGFIFFIAAGRVYVSSNNVAVSIAVASPLLILGSFIGLISVGIMWTMVIVILAVFGVTFIMGRFA